MATKPTGIRNKNYLNVKNSGDPWRDADGKSSGTDSRGHAVFKDAKWGVRAGSLQLKSYFFRHNRRTVAEILSRWAPASDTIGSLPGAPPNSPLKYTNYVTGKMGVGPNEVLGIFNSDGSVGNIAQLRDLFSAMAAYEIGGDFKVPLGDFNGGLDLVQPGIKKDGAETANVNADSEAAIDAATSESKWKIGDSVGRRDKGARNAKADVTTVQEMLREVSMVLSDPGVDPGSIDGKIARQSSKSATVKAIVAFQGRFLTRPDGLIDVGGRTWREMLGVLARGGIGPAVDRDDLDGEVVEHEFYFPFAKLPAKNWTSSPRKFGARRGGGARAHAGCDLYFPVGTVIHAITHGTVVRGPYYFYAGTYAIEVDHGDFIARYGEVQQNAMVRKGDVVRPGQKIARVGELRGLGLSMLHLELYGKTVHGALTVPTSRSLKTASGVPYRRRKDLLDPTPFLNRWKSNLPGAKRAAPTKAVPVKGFAIVLGRRRQEIRAGKRRSRTVGNYKCFWNGKEIKDLAGQMVEPGGPGDNTTKIGDNRDRRIKAGVYRLAIQEGSLYRTYGYKEGNSSASKPKPGVLLRDTAERFAVVIHPGRDYMNSVGCLNPASGLSDADSKISYRDSRGRVIEIIEAMKKKMKSKFPRSGTIPDAILIIKGEPK